MALKVYADSLLTTPVVEILGTLSDSGNQFSVTSEPAEVRVFDSSHTYGLMLTKNTSTPTSPGSGEWGYSNGTVYLGSPLTTGQTAVAFSSGQRIFEGVNTVSGLAKFLSSSADPNDRTKIQQLWLANDDSSKNYTSVQVEAILDFVASAGADPFWFSLSADGSNWISAPLSLSNITGVGSVTFYVKCVVPQDTPVENYRDVYLKISGIEESAN